MPRRIQRQRTKGWRMPEGAVYVGRPTRWGNPFAVGALVRDPGWNGSPACPWPGIVPPPPNVRAVRDRADAVTLFREHTAFHHRLWPVALIRRDLAGRDLVCWCPLEDADGNPVPCHADVLLEVANA